MVKTEYYKIGITFFICFRKDSDKVYGLSYRNGLFVDYWWIGNNSYKISFSDLPEHIQEIFSDPLLEIEYYKRIIRISNDIF